ncbi:hypothetical protein ACJJTC_003268 [Scirpophaga incertulas]
MKSVNVICLVLIVLVVILVQCDEIYVSEEIDPVLYYLLNGEYEGVEVIDDEDEINLNGGIWKCGKCEDIGTSKLIYSEVNSGVEDINDPSLEVQISISLEHMKCIIIRGSTSGIVKHVHGDCGGSTVTLMVKPAEQFVLDVYGDIDE